MKKLFAAVFVLSLVVAPTVTSASFFDLFKTDRAYQGAQVKASTGDKLILQVQQSLTAQGFYKGEMSGVVGSKTKTAIKSFQKMNKLPVTGLLDQATVNAILKSGGGRDGGFFGQYDQNPPSLATMEYRCNNSVPAFVRIISPWQGDSFVYEEDDVNIRVFVCDNTGTGNTHSLGVVSQGIDIDDNSAIEGTLELVGVFDDSYMTPHGQHSWIMNIPLGPNHFEPGNYSLLTSSEGSYRINDVPQYGLNVYGGWTRPFEVTGEVVGGGNCIVTTEQTNPFVSSVPTTNVAPFSDSWTTGYNEMSVFRIQNPTNCPMTIPKIAVLVASTDGLQFVEKEDLRLKTLDDGNMYTPTNVGINYPNSNASFTILDTIPANGYKDYGVGAVDLHYFDPYSMSVNLNLGGVAVGIGQVDFEVSNLSLPVWNGNTINPTPTLGPIWGPVLTVLQ